MVGMLIVIIGGLCTGALVWWLSHREHREYMERIEKERAAMRARHAEEMRCLEAIRAHLVDGTPFDDTDFSPEILTATMRDLVFAYVRTLNEALGDEKDG